MPADPKILQLQKDLLTLGHDPGPIDGIKGKKTSAALMAYVTARAQGPDTHDVLDSLHQEAEAKRAQGPTVRRVKGHTNTTKPTPRNFTKQLYIQVHQTDYWPRGVEQMKTNLYVGTDEVGEVHPPETIIVDNYNDFYHIEVAWVSESRKTVTYQGKTYHREAGEWTPERHALLKQGLVYAVLGLRAHGQNPIIITHRQTYAPRDLDPDVEIAQATYEICKELGFKLDFDFVRGSGKSAKLWYPEGEGKLG